MELFEYLSDFELAQAGNGIFSAPTAKNTEYKKCNITLIELKGELCYQVELFTLKQAFHKNIDKAQIVEEITALFEDFSQFEFLSNGFRHNLKITKKGKILHNKKRVDEVICEAVSHNREKTYLLKEGSAIPPLVDLGVFTKDGKVVKSMYDKYKQINRFVEIINDCIKDDKPKSLNIIDFGCGKSYLTFIVYYYLTEVLGIDTHIIGMDLKADVIQNCNKIAKNYGYENLHFIAGDIAKYTPDRPIDMVIALHACDVATDFALYHAVNMKSRIILSVPCCQHQLNAQIPSDNDSIMSRYGIIKERFSALATDAIRGNCLELMGYQTNLLEFVDMTHSPKNILIRAIKSKKALKNKETYLAEISSICEQFNFEPEITKLFGLNINR
ncbi:MAG: SAM-dependent methyltransferase [Oscillospiraceae bacterium]